MKKPERFSIIHHEGEQNEATLLDGKTKVFREDKLFFLELKRFVVCAPYDSHFVYDNPLKGRGAWTPMCTCGSPAGIVGYNAYKTEASRTDTGEMIVCLSHAQNGKHADGSK